MQKTKLKEKKLYLLPSGVLVRIVRINEGLEKVFAYSYDSFSNEVFDLDFATKFFMPMMTIGEVGKILGKTPHTLRTYERQGLIDKARQFSVGDGAIKTIRLYSPSEVRDLIEFFQNRRGPGRPSEINIGKFDKVKAERLLGAKYIKE